MVTVGRVHHRSDLPSNTGALDLFRAFHRAARSSSRLAARVQGETGGIIVFGLAGLACSAFLPLSISFGGDEFPRLSAVMAGELIAFYQLGYGVAAFGIGPLRDLIGLSFSTIFAAGSIVAVPLVVIAAFLIRAKPPKAPGSGR